MTSVSYEVEIIQSPVSILAEGPHWDIRRQSLYYVDLMSDTPTIYRRFEDKTYTAVIGTNVFFYLLSF